MREQFVTYEIALKLKELGFDKECLAIYTHNNEHYSAGTFFLHTPHPFTIEELTPEVQDVRESAVYILAPLWQQVIDWFREKYYIHIEIRNYQEYQKDNYAYALNFTKDYRYSEKETKIGMIISRIYHDNYEHAREAAILKSIELCKKN